MSIFSGLESVVEEKHPLSKHTWYGLGGPADYFIRPTNVNELRQVVKRCNENNIRIYVLGFGSNLLIADAGLRGAVIKLDSEDFRYVDYNGEKLTAGAGAELSKLVLDCMKKGLSGIEALTGIPGSVGGAVRMNAGGTFGDFGSVVESVTLMDNEGNIFEKSKPELSFDYRSTNITTPFILSANVQLNEGDPEQIMKTVKEIWAFKKNNQPLNSRNCGCIFKNPPGAAAGALIDKAGLKGTQIGQAVVSDKHANFIIAKEGCTSSDVLKLINIVKDKIKEKFDVELELEIQIWD